MLFFLVNFTCISCKRKVQDIQKLTRISQFYYKSTVVKKKLFRCPKKKKILTIIFNSVRVKYIRSVSRFTHQNYWLNNLTNLFFNYFYHFTISEICVCYTVQCTVHIHVSFKFIWKYLMKYSNKYLLITIFVYQFQMKCN